MIDESDLKSTHPRKDFSSIVQRGYKALDLGLTYKNEIDDRLPGALDRLNLDLVAMLDVVPGAILARNKAMAATSAQNALVERGHERVMAIRETVRKSGASTTVRGAYGVGRKIARGRARDVKAALQQIIDRALKEPAEAVALGFIAADVAALEAFVEKLMGADTKQDTMRARAPLSTKERNTTCHRILRAVVLIAGAGRNAFADNPVVRESFGALLASSRRASKAKKSAEPKPDAPGSPASTPD